MISNIKEKIERRQSPRFLLKQELDIVLESGNHLSVESRNISSAGMQIQCDSWATNELEPRGIQSHAVSHLRFKAVIPLSVQGETRKVYANCRVRSVQRLSQDEFILSLSFTDFENGTDAILKAYLNDVQQVKVIHKGVIADNML